MLRTCLAVGAVGSVFAFTTVAFTTVALAADPVMDGQAVKWQAAPPFMPKGAEFAVLAGDPGKDGAYVLRLKLPAGYKMPAHNHPTSEYVTVLSGDFHAGMGDKLDAGKGMALKTGGFIEAPAKMNHYAWTDSGTVVEVSGDGPFEITYVNPADDPRKK